MPLKPTFLERIPSVPDETIDRLEALLKSKIDLKTGYAEPHALARCMLYTLRCLDTSDDAVITRQSFPLLMNKLNCGDDILAVDALFHRYDRNGTGRLSLKDFSDGLFGLLPVARSDMECRNIIALVRSKLLERGENGFRGLTRILRMMDSNGNKKLSRDELKEGLERYDIKLTTYELDTLMFYFDKDRDGCISVTEFIVGIRPKMSDARIALVKLVYLRLDKNPDGVLTFDELYQMYKTNRHPAVLRNEKTSRQVMEEFVSNWNCNGDDVITEKEFIDYYSDLSVTIENDSYFELMVRNAWNISGGVGPTAKKNNVRLLVTHMDGTHTIETLDGDQEVDVSDNASLVTTLHKQGVSDILKVEQALYC